VLGSSLSRAEGGKGANQAVAAARAGGDVAFVGRIGDDEHGRALLASLRGAGVDTSRLVVDPEVSTGLALILVDAGGENEIVVISGANGRVSEADVDAARPSLLRSDILLLQLEIPLPAIRRAIGIVREGPGRVILNAAPAQPLVPELLGELDVLLVNEIEVATVSGIGAPVEPAVAARLLLETGVRAVVLTLGAAGAMVVSGDQETCIDPFPATPVDTTGAGDAFAGNFAFALDRGLALAEAARFASAAAALSVQRAGAQPSMPLGAETEALLREGRT
jgi:ribokinase